ncbi:MAG: hypothetical protein CMM27_10580 [Rhodospirillaceae bacterium]|nr:hypothetical protein [Rhodospirillaceae bacterium]|tara:strand:- start:6477 stop:7322 length:846 start_codon:yes stop_codon:yes gene_type:complete
MKLLVAAAVMGGVLAAAPANAHHDKIYTPCDTTTGHVHMSFEEVSARVSIMEQEGVIPPGMISRYVEARDGGKGNEDPRFVWARNLQEGQILSLGNWANGEHPELEQLMFNSGLVAEWQLDANKQVRRFDDPYWRQANPLSPAFTVWQSLCMANLGYSIPMFEVDGEGQWVSNVPSTTTTTPPVTTTTQLEEEVQSDPVREPEEALPVFSGETKDVGSTPKGSYDLFDAEWDGYPFEATVRLLEDRYPPGTPGKNHFRLSAAVEFLRGGGMIRGLDNLWHE